MLERLISFSFKFSSSSFCMAFFYFLNIFYWIFFRWVSKLRLTEIEYKIFPYFLFILEKEREWRFFKTLKYLLWGLWVFFSCFVCIYRVLLGVCFKIKDRLWKKSCIPIKNQEKSPDVKPTYKEITHWWILWCS